MEFVQQHGVGGVHVAEDTERQQRVHELGAVVRSDGAGQAQLQSGGVGLNLQHFNKILFTGPWWTKALMDQAVGRAVRIGQRDVVQVYNIVLKEEGALNIDTYMSDKAADKGSFCQAVLEAATNTV
jgi:hypothetical protein